MFHNDFAIGVETQVLSSSIIVLKKYPLNTERQKKLFCTSETNFAGENELLPHV